MADSAIITSLCWVQRGFAKQIIQEYEPTEEEKKAYQQVSDQVKDENLMEITEDIEKNLANMNLDKYDQEDETPIFTTELGKLKPKDEQMEDEDIEEGSSEEVSDFEDNGEGKGAKKAQKDDYPSELEDSEEEKEDYTIRKNDSLIVAATAENDHSNLEVYIYDHQTSDLYVHHEIILSSYPLCLEWLNTFRGEKANLVIVGTFLPEIEIWDINKEDCEPLYTLGSIDGDSQGKKKKKKLINKFNKTHESGINEASHTDAVMCLSLNPFQNEYLASGSADTTVKIWDLEELTAKATFANLHKNKVQLVRWNNVNESLLLTGGYDRVVNVVDVRERPLGENAIKFHMKKELKDIESGQWHPMLEHNFVISTENGMVQGFDMRNTNAPVFEILAHEKACSSVTFSPHIPNMMATCSVDEYVKVWDIANNNGTEPKLISYKKMGMGELFSVSFYKDIPWVLAAGGSKGEIAVWDTEENETIAQHFTPFIDKSKIPSQDFEDGQDDDMESDEDEEDKKAKKAKKVQQINKVTEGIKTIQELKKKGK